MLHADLADTSLASEWPDVADACDTLADRLKESLAPFIPRDQHSRAFAAIEALADEADAGGAADRQSIVHETLRAVYGDTRFASDIRIIAKAALATISRTGESYQAMADEFAVTRACPHNHARRIEDTTGIKPRRAKSELAREKSTAAATGRRRGATSGFLRGGKARLFSFFPGLA